MNAGCNEKRGNLAVIAASQHEIQSRISLLRRPHLLKLILIFTLTRRKPVCLHTHEAEGGSRGTYVL